MPRPSSLFVTSKSFHRIHIESPLAKGVPNINEVVIAVFDGNVFVFGELKSKDGIAVHVPREIEAAFN